MVRSMVTGQEEVFGARRLLWKVALAGDGGLEGAKTTAPRLAARSLFFPLERSLGVSQTVRSGRIVRSNFQSAVLGGITLEELEW